jgi:uncharacterized membrane protein
MTHPSRTTDLDLLHPRLVGAGAALLIAACMTDLLYWHTLLPEWETFSIWLLTGGLVLAAWSGIALILDLVLGRVRTIQWGRFLTLTAAALLSFLNAFVHSRDGYTAVMPEGLGLSAIVAILLFAVGWQGWTVATARTVRRARPLHPQASPEGIRP